MTSPYWRVRIGSVLEGTSEVLVVTPDPWEAWEVFCRALRDHGMAVVFSGPLDKWDRFHYVGGFVISNDLWNHLRVHGFKQKLLDAYRKGR